MPIKKKWHKWEWGLLLAFLIIVLLVGIWLIVKYTKKSGSGGDSSKNISNNTAATANANATATKLASSGGGTSSTSNLMSDASDAMMGYNLYTGGKYAYNYMYGTKAAGTAGDAAAGAGVKGAGAEAADAADAGAGAAVDAGAGAAVEGAAGAAEGGSILAEIGAMFASLFEMLGPLLLLC